MRRLLAVVLAYACWLAGWWGLWTLNQTALPSHMVIPAFDGRWAWWPFIVLMIGLAVWITIWWEKQQPQAQAPRPKWRLPDATSWRDPIDLGVDEQGKPVRVSTWDVPQWLIGGTSGSGKTVAMRLIVAHYASDPDAILWGVDGKGNRDDWAGMRPRFERWASITDRLGGPAAYLRMLEDLGLLIDQRQDEPGRDYPGMLVVLDDAGRLRKRLPRDDRALADDLLTGIVQTCRAANIMVLIATQRPSASQMDTDQRSQSSLALCMQVDSMDDARMVLGVRPPDDQVVRFPIGTGLLKAERGAPRLVKVHHLTDAMWQRLGQRFTPAEAPADIPPSLVLIQGELVDSPQDEAPQDAPPQGTDPLLATAWVVVDAAPGRKMTTAEIRSAVSFPGTVEQLGAALSGLGWSPRAKERVGSKTFRFRYADDAPVVFQGPLERPEHPLEHWATVPAPVPGPDLRKCVFQQDAGVARVEHE